MRPCHQAGISAAHTAAPAVGLLASAGRHSLFVLGTLSFAVGAIGLVLPLLPTTIFWIIAAWAWSKSCPRLQRWLYTLPGAGAHIRAWLEHGTISRRGKHFALAGLAIGVATASFALHANATVLALAVLPQIAAAFYIATRPESEPLDA